MKSFKQLSEATFAQHVKKVIYDNKNAAEELKAYDKQIVWLMDNDMAVACDSPETAKRIKQKILEQNIPSVTFVIGYKKLYNYLHKRKAVDVVFSKLLNNIKTGNVITASEVDGASTKLDLQRIIYQQRNVVLLWM